MIALNTPFGDFGLSADGRALLEEAMSEFETDQHNEAKKVIKNRLLEIKRMEMMLEKAKADLAALLQHSQSEILMLDGK